MAAKASRRSERHKRARAVHARAQREFTEWTSVHGVALGRASKGGRPDPKRPLALVVFVRKKRKSPPSGEALPPNYRGLPVDVVELRRPRLASTDNTVLHFLHPTVVGGIAISREGTKSYGTIGGIVLDTTDRPYALTSHHVVAAKRCGVDVAGQRMEQPDDPEIPQDRYLGQVPRDGAIRDEEIDAALVTIEGTAVMKRKWRAAVWDDSDADADLVRPPPATPPYEKPVYKIGATTGRTDGVLRFWQSTVSFPCAGGGEIEMTGQMLVKPEGESAFGELGDSGALVLDASDRAVGLLHGLVDVRTRPSEPWLVHGVASWLPTVLSRLRVRLP